MKLPKWQSTEGIDANHIVESYVDDTGKELAAIEYFGHGCYYPRALNAETGNWERGGPRTELRDAIAWAERAAYRNFVRGSCFLFSHAPAGMR
jgi:hypothetical protein